MEPGINRLHLRIEDGLPWPQDLVRRKFSARDVLSMMLKHITVKSETKYLHAQFGEVHTHYFTNVELGMNATMYSLFGHKHIRVKWDRSDEGLMLASNLIKYFFEFVVM